MRKLVPRWTVPTENGTSKGDLAEMVGIPHQVISAVFIGKCRDQRIPITVERQKRFAELLLRSCSSFWFTLKDSGVGPECARGVSLALSMTDRFVSVDLAKNQLAYEGAALLARTLP